MESESMQESSSVEKTKMIIQNDQVFCLLNSLTKEHLEEILINVYKYSKLELNYYHGIMGVPITFLDKYCPEQFEILGIANSARWIGYKCFTIVNNHKIYNRIILKRRIC